MLINEDNVDFLLIFHILKCVYDHLAPDIIRLILIISYLIHGSHLGGRQEVKVTCDVCYCERVERKDERASCV